MIGPLTPRPMFTHFLAILIPLGTVAQLPPPSSAQEFTITTIAGTPPRAPDGDGGPAIEANLNWPGGVAVDGAGNVYIADRGNDRIRRVDGAGIITTIAGTGESGSSADGGPAIEANLNWPAGVAVDGAGNVYIADRGNDRIRRVDGAGVITTIAGTGVRGFSGDGGPAVEAKLDGPSGIAVDGAGNVYIADRGNDRIRRVDGAGVITTIAGTGVRGFSGDGGPAVEAKLDGPSGIAVDGAGNVYIADYNNHRVRRVDGAGIITTIAGTGVRGFSGDGGPAVEAELGQLQGGGGGRRGRQRLYRPLGQPPDTPRGRLGHDHYLRGRDGDRRNSGGRGGQRLYQQTQLPPDTPGGRLGHHYDDRGNR